MVEAGGRDALAVECHALCRYLVSEDPSPEVLAAYQKAHAIGRLGQNAPTPTDAALLRLARCGPACTRLADAYAGVFANSGLLRRKLVLLLAILESRASTAMRLDTAVPGSRIVWLGVSAAQGLAWTIRVALGAMVVTALRVGAARGGPR